MEEKKDPMEELAEKAKAKIVLGKFVFDNIVLPKAKETVEKAKSAVKTLANELKDRLDPTSGLARHARDVKQNLKEKGFSDKAADDIVKQTVAGSLKNKTKKENS